MKNDAENEIEIPSECEISFFNDEVTPGEFVKQLLIQVFNKSREEADFLTEETERNGKSVIGVYTYDIAQTRAAIARSRVSKSGFPLKIEVSK